MTKAIWWALGLALGLAPGVARAEPGGDVVIKEKGCVACHSVDGAARQGPTFAGLAGRVRRVNTGGAPRELIADVAYLRRSITDPDADVVEGYKPGLMPGLKLTPAELDATVAYLEALAPVQPLPPPSPGGLLPLLASAVAFVGLHLGLSSAALRPRLVGALGAGPFQGIYSVLVLGAMLAMIHFFGQAPYIELWSLPRAARWSPVLVMPVSIFLLVAGNSTKSPTMAGMEKSASAGPVGVLRITRHPALWGFALWGLAHVLPNGDARSLIVFASVVTLSLAGMAHIDARRAADQGEAWAAFAARTSVFPFVAIAQGRNHLSLREIGWARALGSLLLYVGLLHGHRLLIGVPALP